MRIKEQILDSIVRDWATDITRTHAYEAMDEYAKEMAMEFQNWKSAKGWVLYDDGWRLITDSLKVEAITLEQIFELYLKSKQ